MPLVISDITEQLKQHPEYDCHEKIIMAEDPDIGFKAFIGVHSTSRGPALGGCRYWSRYKNEAEAITDVLRLSKGMTYKNSISDLQLGGGKAVIMGRPGTKHPDADCMQALGLAVDTLRGSYVTAEDVGTGVDYMLIARGATQYVSGLPLDIIVSEYIPDDLSEDDMPSADPSPYTAYGVFQGIKAAVKYKLGQDNLDGLRMLVKGYGHVAKPLCEMLHNEGAKLLITEIDHKRQRDIIETYGADSLLAEDSEIMAQPADVYVPCALGGDINDKTIPMLVEAGVGIVAGAANNQLATDVHSEMLRENNILYAPDYVINSGGVIAVAVQYHWLNQPGKETFMTHRKISDRIAHIYDVLLKIFERGDLENKAPLEVAHEIAREGFTSDGGSVEEEVDDETPGHMASTGRF